MRTLIQVATVLAISTPIAASADVYDIHVGGICSTGFTGGNGDGYLGYWPGETSIDAPVDQTNSMATATSELASVLDTYCTGDNLCYVYTYSNGGAVISRTLSVVAGAWNIGYIVDSASNEGGSEIGGTGWVGEIFGGCYLAGHIGPSDHRNGWNHYDTDGFVIGMIGGDGWLAPYVQSAVLPGHDDGAVAEHSSGGYAQVGSYDSICESGKWTNHQAWWSCEYGDLNHYDMKMRGICDDGGATGCKQ
jgi:hypothetical protein